MTAKEGGEEESKVTPAEDLMREHAVLSRLLLIYETGLPAGPGSGPPLKEIGDAARLVRTFIEEYHEKLEEDYLFPRFEKAGKLVELVKILRRQHEAGRRLTDAVLEVTGGTGGSDTARLERSLRAFIRMYRPHAARESTVLFPQLQTVVSPREYDQMGEAFEDIEHQKFGPEGFEGIVANVADVEKRLRLYDLAAFTPGLT
jgi:hemerythrin-like domain-containing protein